MPRKRPSWPHDKRAVLTESEATTVLRYCREPCDDAVFAERFGVTRQCISSIRRGRTWVWLRLELSWETSVANIY